MLKLKLQTFGHLMWTADSIFPWCWEGLKAEGNKGITDAMDMNLGILWDMVVDRATWHAVVHEVTKSRTQLGNWTTNKEIIEHNTSSLLLVFLLPFNNCHELFFCLCFFYGLLCMCVCVLCHIWLCNPIDCSQPGSSVCGIFLARTLERVAISYSRYQNCMSCVSCVGRGIPYHCATWEGLWLTDYLPNRNLHILRNILAYHFQKNFQYLTLYWYKRSCEALQWSVHEKK